MNREILFKAKRLDNGEWIEGYYEKYNNRHYINKETDRLNTGGYPIREFIEVDENTLCQFTGLTDKHGNKIWENDIVSEKIHPMFKGIIRFGNYTTPYRKPSNIESDVDSKHKGFYIEWQKPCEFRKDIGFWAEKNISTIGNIFDNADLLGKE